MATDDLFDESKMLPDTGESLMSRRKRKPTIAWDPDRGPDHDMAVLRRGVEAQDAREAARYLAEPMDPTPTRGRRSRRLSEPQFGNLEGLAEVQERMANEPFGTKIPKASRIMDRPPAFVTQDNWERGMGDTWTERRFSPRARAQGHLLGAAAMFVASTPPLVGRPTVTPIRY